MSLSADGTVVAIGSVSNGENGSNSGHVRVFSKPATLSPISGSPSASASKPSSQPSESPVSTAGYFTFIGLGECEDMSGNTYTSALM